MTKNVAIAAQEVFAKFLAQNNGFSLIFMKGQHNTMNEVTYIFQGIMML